MNNNQNSKEELLLKMRDVDEKSSKIQQKSEKLKIKSSFWIKSAVVSIVIVLIAFGIYYFNFVK